MEQLYKYVIDYKLPLKFFTLYHNQVKSINDFIDRPIKNFNATDMIFVYFESLIDKDQLLNYSNIKRKEIDLDQEWIEYDVKDLKKANPKLKLTGTKVYYVGDINPIIKDKNFLNLIVTEDQFNLAVKEE